MNRLFAPWRMTYIGSDTKDSPDCGAGEKVGCIFCDKPKDSCDRENLIIHRGDTAFVLLNLYPYNNGHMMVAPYKHTAKMAELDRVCLGEIMELVKMCEASLFKAYSPHGYNIGMNVGHVAGAGIADHLHMHVVPRWSGDTNFMPVIAETKVLPDSLVGSYDKLLSAWQSIFHD